LETFKGTP